MQVCIALNADQPVWYSMIRRVFAYSSLEASQLRAYDPSDGHQDYHNANLIRSEQITTDKHISLVLSCHRQIYGTEKVLGKDVIKTASMILPDLNCIVFDSWGHYVGHHICMTIKKDTFEDLKQKREVETYLTSEKISNILTLNEGVFFSYSTFAVNINVAYLLLINSFNYYMNIKEKERYMVAFYPPSLEIKELFKCLDLKLVFKKVNDRHSQDSNISSLYEIKLDVMMRSIESFLTLFGRDTRY